MTGAANVSSAACLSLQAPPQSAVNRRTMGPMGELLPETPIELFLTSTAAVEGFCFLGSTFLLDFGPPCSELDSSIEEAKPESLV